jgi:heme exporter protein B
MSLFIHLVRTDLQIAFRHAGELLQPLWFMALVVALFPLGISPEAAELRQIAGGVVWIAALLASLLGLEAVFAHDEKTGRLEQWLLSDASMLTLVAARLLSRWLVSGLPIVLISPLLAIWLQLQTDALVVLSLSLLLGTPIMTLLCALAAALTLSSRQAATLMSLLVAPLYVPLLIFATSAVKETQAGANVDMQLLLITAMLVLAVTLIPPAITVALNIHLRE